MREVSLTWTEVNDTAAGEPVTVSTYSLACAPSPEDAVAASATSDARRFPAGTTSAVLRLPLGTWHCSVRAIGDDGAIGDASNTVEKALAR